VDNTIIGKEDVVLGMELSTAFERLVLGFETRDGDDLDDARGKIRGKVWALNQLFVGAARRSGRVGGDEAYP